MELRPSWIGSVLGGTWIRKPGADAPLAGVSIDSRDLQTGTLFIAIQGDTHDGHDFALAAANGGARMLMVERGCDAKSIADSVGVLRVGNTRAALMQLATAYRASFTSTTVIAVTGSSGKTTTRELIHSVLAEALPGAASPKSFNNDIGVPLSLLAVRPEHRYAVIEVGINDIGEMQPLAEIVRPDIAVITNIGASHLEGLRDVATVAREKLLLTTTLRPGGMAILHADSPALRSGAGHIPNVLWFGESADAHIRLTKRGVDQDGHWFELADGSRFQLALHGRHNAINALSAIAVGRQLGLTDASINAGLVRARSLPMRTEDRSVAGIRVINDAYNANPQSMLAGLEAFLEMTADAAPRVLVLGDMCELGESGPALHETVGEQIGERIAGAGEVHVYVVGTLASEHLAAGLVRSPFGGASKAFSAMTPGVADVIAGTLNVGDVVFIKGSRAMALEALVLAIERRSASSSTEVTSPQPASRV